MATAFTPSDIPSRFEYQDAQRRIYQMWESAGYFDADPDPKKTPFTIVIPPPNVTGALHLGHALNNSLQDILIRMKRMQGFNALWMPGTDHAGIATQAVVERRLREEEGKSRHDLGREALVRRIWQWKDQYEARILQQLKAMGSSCDWRRTRFTLDEVCARAVRETFYDLFQKTWIYRGKRLVNWDTFLQTAVSDDEVVHEEVKGHFWHFRYPVIDPQPGEPTHVTIATTRPETMLGDTAVATHPDPARALDSLEADLNDRLTSASEKEKPALQIQLENIQERRETMLGALQQLRDMALAGRRLMLPLMDREIPLIVDKWAKPELGSGCVKITPAHDPNDYEVGKRQELPMINILNPDGTMNEAAGKYQGLNIKQARQEVVADLDELGLLVEVEDRLIDIAHSDRSKTPIEPYLANQWFVQMDQLAQSAMDAVRDERVKIFPTRYRKGYLDWLGEKRDWPVSRQLWWGHQIPIWSRECTEEAEVQRSARELEQNETIRSGDACYHVERHDESPADTGASSDHVATIHVCIRNADDAAEKGFEQMGFVRVDDVLDTWFSSALWPHSTLGWPEQTEALKYYYPTSTLITSRDIITLWVARMVLAGLNNQGDVPFREVFIHPKILDGYGVTMSKSKGNGVDPINVIEKFGADALRFGLAYLTTETQDVRMPVQFECPHCEKLIDQTTKNRILKRIDCPHCREPFKTQWAEAEEDLALPAGAVVSERFEIARNFCNKLWNASRFVLLNLEGFEPSVVSDEELAFEDRWLLSRLATLSRVVTQSLDEYHYAEAASYLYKFAWDDFCSFYVEMCKPRFQDEQQRPTAQRVIAYALDTLLRLLHPMIPFITEEVWQTLGKVAPQRGLSSLETAADSVMIAQWPRLDDKWVDSTIESQFSEFQSALGALREIRSRQNIAPKQHVEFSVRCEPDLQALLRPMEAYFASMARASSVEWGPNIDVPASNATIRLERFEVIVDLKDFIDVPAEIERNAKQLERMEKQIGAKKAKLGNASFTERAPADVVQREREGLAQLLAERELVIQALDALRGS